MKIEKHLCCLFLSALALSASAQSLDDLEKRLEAAKKAEAAKHPAAPQTQRQKTETPTGTALIVKADSDCALSVNGVVKGQLTAEQTATVNVHAGENLIECVGGSGRVEQTENIPAGGQKVVRLSLGRVQTVSGAVGRFQTVSGGVLDKEQNVVWAARDNGSDIDWSGAQSYCNSLGSRWALPSSAQLQNLYDASGQYGKSITLPGFTFTVKPATPLIDLTGSGYWSSEQNGSSEAWLVALAHGTRYSFGVSSSNFERALCVRHF